MFFLGDLASNKSFDLQFKLSEEQFLIVNCEGYIVEKPIEPNFNAGVFNSIEGIESLNKKGLVLSLANNHIMDKPDGVAESIRIASEKGIMHCGANMNLESSSKPLILTEEEEDIAIISAGWDLIGCVHATKNSQGVFPLLQSLILPKIKEQKAMKRKVALFLHWGYETEIYPLPLHRNMAREFIDAGADIIVGCHAHCLQGYEVYKGKHIFYGIGNSAFQESYYYGGKLKFPSYCDSGLVVNWLPSTDEVNVATVDFNQEILKISNFTLPNKNESLMKLSGFSNLNDNDYYNFFKNNRLKRKALPIFTKNDQSFDYFIKLNYVKFRGMVIHFLFKLGIKKR